MWAPLLLGQDSPRQSGRAHRPQVTGHRTSGGVGEDGRGARAAAVFLPSHLDPLVVSPGDSPDEARPLLLPLDPDPAAPAARAASERGHTDDCF